MTDSHFKYVLAGGGIASSAAAVAIRNLDATGSILMIGQEINRPYHRPPLSKDYLKKQKRHEDLFALPPGWFAQHHAQLCTGRRVTSLETSRQTVAMDDGREISYDKLLLATGASVDRLMIPGTELPNIFYLRSIDDADRLHHAIDKAKNEGRKQVVVIGGGILGVELTSTLTALGLHVQLVVGSHQHPWSKFAGETAGKFISRFMQEKQVDVHNGRRAVTLQGDGRVQRVVLDDGSTIACDFAIAAVGSHANRDLLRGTPIAAEKAILVDQHCRTSDENVYAAGDCAAVFDPLFGKHRIIDHWDNAVATGEIAGQNMAGLHATYSAVSVFGTEAFGLPATIWGEPKLVDRRIVRGSTSGNPPEFIEIGIASDGRIAQVLAIGQNHDAVSLRGLVEQRFNAIGKEEQLKDPGIPLSSFIS